MSFSHHSPDTVTRAVELLSASGDGARVVAGGTDLLGLIKDRVHPQAPAALVDLKTVPGLDRIEERNGGLALGSLVRLSDLERNPLVRERCPVLAEAAHAVASPQLRNMGTVGGNICQEPRCWYYRAPDNSFHCTRKGGRYCNAFTGDNRQHAITGPMKVSTRPCTTACPGAVEIPEYMELLRAGDTDAAAQRLLTRNPMPAVTGRVCPHTCEDECNRGLFDEAVSVREVERFLGDHVLDHPALLGRPAGDSGDTVAVVGSGPAGLSAAYYLRLRGHQVTVFEREEQPGGLLRYGIPAYRLPNDVLDRLLAAYEGLGIEFRCGVTFGLASEPGAGETLESLQARFDGVFVASGAWGLPRIGLAGEDELAGGLTFLSEVAKGSRRVPGPRLLVIGGGSVAMDVAVTARRLGAEQVTVACLETCDAMPALLEEVEEALSEGIALLPSCGPARLLRDGERLTGLELVRCTSVLDEQCCFAPTFDESERQVVEADEVILAVGQRVDHTALAAAGVPLEGTRLTVDPRTQATAVPGVFAGGDVVTGPATVIAALAAGRRAAESLHARLAGAAVIEEDGRGQPLDVAPRFQSFDPACQAPSAACEAGPRDVCERAVDGEDCATQPAAVAACEAARCFNCGCVAVSPSDLAPVLVALDATVVTTVREIPAAGFFAVALGGSTVLDAGEIVLEVVVPKDAAGRRCAFRKFRLRNAIDFPIVSAAVSFRLERGAIEDARVVLGAVAPVPLRAAAAEAALDGRPLEEVATAAFARHVAACAVEGAQPLVGSAYKTQIVGALVARAVAQAAGETHSIGGRQR